MGNNNFHSIILLVNYLDKYTQNFAVINMDNGYINTSNNQTNPYLKELRNSNVEIRKNSNHNSNFTHDNQRRLPQILPPIAYDYIYENHNKNDQNNNQSYKNNIYKPDMFYDPIRSSNANTKLNSYYKERLSNLNSSLIKFEIFVYFEK